MNKYFQIFLILLMFAASAYGNTKISAVDQVRLKDIMFFQHIAQINLGVDDISINSAAKFIVDMEAQYAVVVDTKGNILHSLFKDKGIRSVKGEWSRACKTVEIYKRKKLTYHKRKISVIDKKIENDNEVRRVTEYSLNVNNIFSGKNIARVIIGYVRR